MSAALTTPSALKAWMGIKSQDAAVDALLASLIESVSAAIDAWLDGPVLAANYDERYNGTGKNRLVLRRWPVQSVFVVQVDGRSLLPQQTPCGSGWLHDSGLLVLCGDVFARGTRNVRVCYRAGFETVPADVQLACHLLCAQRYRERDWVGMTSKTLAGETISFATWASAADSSIANAGMPPAVLSLLTGYRRVLP